jgi:uncharacterized membrane protein YeaQ/YmgE (transglycosylase-associated protein family)
MHELIRFLLVGLVSGWIAAILVRGSLRVRGCLTYMVIGMLGAIVGGYVFRALGISQVGSVITATVGAIILLVSVRFLRNL